MNTAPHPHHHFTPSTSQRSSSMSAHLLALAPFLLHAKPLLSVRREVALSTSSSASLSTPSAPLSRAARENGGEGEGTPPQVVHRVLQVWYDEVAEDVVLLTSLGLVCVYHLHVPLGSNNSQAACNLLFSFFAAEQGRQQSRDPQHLANPHALPTTAPPLAFVKRCPLSSIAPSSAAGASTFLAACGDGSSGTGKVTFYRGCAGTDHGAAPAGSYACTPRNLRFPSGTRYPILDALWLLPSSVDTPGASSASRVGPAAAGCLACVTPISIDLLSVLVRTREGKARVTVGLPQRYTTHNDLWCYHPKAGLLWSVNARKPNIVKPFLLSHPLSTAASSSSSHVSVDGGARSRDEDDATRPHAGIIACPKLQLPGSGRELFPPAATAAAAAAASARQQYPSVEEQTGTHFFTPGDGVHRVGGSHFLGCVVLYDDEVYLYHMQLKRCRLVLYRYHGLSHLGTRTGKSEDSPFTLFAVLSLAELPAVRQYAERLSSCTTSAASPSPPAPSLAVLVIDDVLLVHSLSDQLTSAFDVAVTYQRVRERQPASVPGTASRAQSAAAALVDGAFGGSGRSHATESAKAAAAGSAQRPREGQRPRRHSCSSRDLAQRVPLRSTSAAGETARGADAWAGEGIWAAQGAFAEAESTARGGGGRGDGVRPPSPWTPVPAMGEDTATWQAASLATAQTQTLLPLLTASFGLLPPPCEDGGEEEERGNALPSSLPRRARSQLVLDDARQVCVFASSHTRLPLCFSFPKKSAASSDHSGCIAVHLLDLNPVSIAVTSALSEAGNASQRFAFLLRRRCFLLSAEAHKRALVELLLAAIAHGQRRNSGAVPGPVAFAERTGALEAIVWHGAWASRKRREGHPHCHDSGHAHSGRAWASRDGEDRVVCRSRVAGAFVVVAEAEEEGGREDAPAKSHRAPLCSLAGDPFHAGRGMYETFTQDDVVQQLLPPALSVDAGSLAASHDDHDGAEQLEEEREGRGSREPLERASEARRRFASFWSVAAYVKALLLSSQPVKGPTLLLLLDVFTGVVKAVAALSGAEAPVLRAHLREVAETVLSISAGPLEDSLSAPVACKWVELCCCYGGLCNSCSSPGMHGKSSHALSHVSSRWGGWRGPHAELFFRKGVRMLTALADVDAVVESVQVCLQHQQPVTATRLLRGYLGHFLSHPHEQSENEPGIGWTAADETVLGECMYVVLRAAAEAVDATGLARHQHAMAERTRQAPAAAARGMSHEEAESAYRWRASCRDYAVCFEEIASLLLLLLTSPPPHSPAAPSPPLSAEGRGEPRGAVGSEEAHGSRATFGGVPKGMASFTERYNRLVP